MIERKALIFNIQKYNMYDGPGIRTLVFFKGCPLRCKWCSNPESQLRQFQILYKRDLCVLCGACVQVCPVGIHEMSAGRQEHLINRDLECIGCGSCVEACPAAALAVAGQKKSISELMAIIEEDMPFYETSGGGLTIGGGEPLMQPQAAANLLMACKGRGINTAMETCGYARPEVLMKVAEFTDLFLFDVKHMDPEKHHELTGVRNESILENLKLLLDNKYNVRVRLPLLKGLNDGDAELGMLMDFLQPYREQRNFTGVDLLPYHRLGVYKYGQLGKEYGITDNPVLSETDLDRMERLFTERNFPVTVIRH